MSKVLFDAAELVKQYRGERGIVEGEPCQKCLHAGVLNPVYFYRDINNTNGKGRCFSCYHVEGNKATSETSEFMELPNGHKVYEGKKCRNCGHSLRIFDAETGARLGIKGSGTRKSSACYHCARLKQSTLEPVAAHRSFLDDVNKGVWKFSIRSVEASRFVEVIARTPAERGQVKQLFATCMMMNRHAELSDRPERYDVDHYFPSSGSGDFVGMTNISNLRIISRTENRSKRDDVPARYQPEQVLNITELQAITDQYKIGEVLKRWLDSGESATDFTPERQAVWQRKQAEQKAAVEAIENRIGADFCKSVYAAVDKEATSLFDVLTVAQNKLKRFKTGGNQKIVEDYKRRLQLHGRYGFVPVPTPDLEAMAYIGKGAILWAIEATVSNVIDGITILMEQGITPDEQRIIDAITFDCIGWAMTNIESTGEVLPFESPLLGVFGTKIFAVKEKHGKHCLTVYTNDRKGQTRKMLDLEQMTAFDGGLIGSELISSSDGDVLERLELFNNETLMIQRQKQAVADAKERAIQSIKENAGRLLVSSGELLGVVEGSWLELVEIAKRKLCNPDESEEDNAAVIEFFSNQWRPAFDAEKSRAQGFMTMCRDFIGVPFSEPQQAADAFQQLRLRQPVINLPDPFRKEPVHDIDRLRAIGERLEKLDAEKLEQSKATKQTKADKAEFMRSPAGQQWLIDQKRKQRSNQRNLPFSGTSRDNRH